MVHEYDAIPEDFFAGFAIAESTQLHPRYPQYYNGGMPWELFYIDFDNGAQLMLAVMAFHDTPNGTLTPVHGKDQPTYKVLSTLRLPDGRSVNLDDAVRVEHLDYRKIVGQTPGPFIQVKGVWTQGWKFRASFGGGKVKAGDGTMADVPPFDLGLTPQLEKDEPKLDDKGTGLTQRVPFDAAGSYGGCPIRGFGFTELIINWTDREKRDPWWTGGELPKVPAHCGDPVPKPPTGQPGNLDPGPEPSPPPRRQTPRAAGSTTRRTTRARTSATSNGGVSGYGAEPGGWTGHGQAAGPERPDRLHELRRVRDVRVRERQARRHRRR